MNATTENSLGRAAHAAFVGARFPHLDRADLAWQEFTDEQRGAWEAAAKAAIDAAGARTVTVEALAAVLTDRQFPVRVGNGFELRAPSRPHDLAVQLLTAVDGRLTDNPPHPGPESAAAMADNAGPGILIRELRALVAEILAVFDPSEGGVLPGAFGQVQIAEWRERAGIERTP